MATVCLTAICTTSCKQITPLSPDEQLTEQLIGKWKATNYTMDFYQDGQVIDSITADYPQAYIDVYNSDGTWAAYISQKCDDPSLPANADKVDMYIKGTFAIKDSVLTTTDSSDNTYGDELAGSQSQYKIVSLTNSTMSHVADIEGDGMIIKMRTNFKRIQ